MKRAHWSCGEVIGKEMASGMAATSCSSWKHSRNIFGPMKHKGLLLYFPRGADSASLKSTVGPVEKIEGLEGSRQTVCIPAETHICQQDASSLSLSFFVPCPTSKTGNVEATQKNPINTTRKRHKWDMAMLSPQSPMRSHTGWILGWDQFMESWNLCKVFALFICIGIG